MQFFRDENLAAAFARALNDWLAAEWLAKDPRLQRLGRAADPVAGAVGRRRSSGCAGDKRFVQVLMLAMGEHPLGKSMYWPIYAAAERHGFTVGIHAGSSYHHALTGSGWPTYYLEDYAAQSLGFHTQLGSLICEGVFVKYPKLKVVLIESGVTWLPPYLWRLSKFWRGVRNEVPWIDRSPEEFVRDHIRLTIQPFDAPPSAAHIGRIMDQLQSDDMLLFSTDFPHWQFDGDDMLPAGLSPELAPQDPDRQPARHLSPSQGGPHDARRPAGTRPRCRCRPATPAPTRRPASRSSTATCIPRCARSPTSSRSCRRAGASTSRSTARGASSAWATSPIRSRRRAPAGATPGRRTAAIRAPTST